jgi:hypothetical protein
MASAERPCWEGCRTTALLDFTYFTSGRRAHEVRLTAARRSPVQDFRCLAAERTPPHWTFVSATHIRSFGSFAVAGEAKTANVATAKRMRFTAVIDEQATIATRAMTREQDRSIAETPRRPSHRNIPRAAVAAGRWEAPGRFISASRLHDIGGGPQNAPTAVSVTQDATQRL